MSQSDSSTKILLISGTSPGEPGVGGVILQDLIQATQGSRFEASIFSPRHVKNCQHLESLPTRELSRRYEPSWRPVAGMTGELIASLATSFKRNPHLAHLTEQVKSHIDQFKPDLVLTVLESITAIEVTRRLLGQMKCSLRCIVWDDVQLLCDQSNLDRWTAQQLKQSFGKVLQAADRVAVICENMQQAYQQRYRVTSHVLRHGIDLKLTKTTLTQQENQPYRIGFAGSITAPDCFDVLIAMLDKVDWQFQGRDIVLRLLGSRYLLNSRKPQRIEYFGWRDVLTTSKLLGECDLTYLPQSFQENLRHFSELSFPTKLSTYVVPRKPILLHAPEYASLTSFWQHHSPGPYCGSLQIHDIQQALEQTLTASEERTRQWQDSAAHIHEQVLSPDRFRAGIDQLLGQV